MPRGTLDGPDGSTFRRGGEEIDPDGVPTNELLKFLGNLVMILVMGRLVWLGPSGLEQMVMGVLKYFA